MGYNSYGMGGGGGYGMGGGMGGGAGSSTTMMSSAMGASVCLSMLALGGFMIMSKETPTPTPETDAPASTSTSPSSATSPSNLDGIRLITVGDISMRVEGNCGNGKVAFRQSKDGKWEWNVKRIGATSDGLNYYTLESYGKLFGNACNKRFLTAPYGCKGGPSLAGPQSGAQQLWVITGSDSTGYQIESLSCRQSKTKSYLMQSGQKQNKVPQFSLRSGSSFRVDAPLGI